MIKNIISVHVPKVAGTSFLHKIKKIYGENELLLDYQDDPTNPLSIRNVDPHFYDAIPIQTIFPNRIVHGHFHPRKYEYIDEAFRITFLRHPIDNMISIYNFWTAHDKGFWDHPVFKYFKDQNLSISRLAMIPQLRYLYTRSYFGDFDMEKFNFIGDYAHYDNELIRLGESLGVLFDLDIRQNTTLEYLKKSSSAELQKNVLTEVETGELAQILSDDINFYEKYKGN